MVLDDLVERLPDQFDMEDIRGRVDEYTPYVMVAIQVSIGSQGVRGMWLLVMALTWSFSWEASGSRPCIPKSSRLPHA
jgi:hypothetical protein